MGQHGQGQETVRNSASKRTLCCSLFIHVNELAVFGALGKFVDALLAYFEPFARLQCGSDVIYKLFLWHNLKTHDDLLLGGDNGEKKGI